MRIYVLHLAGSARLASAFDLLLADEEVASCMIESALHRMRFLAPRKHGDDLVERVYQQGGLLWCSRHDLMPVPGHD
jgi:hypothetical protein